MDEKDTITALQELIHNAEWRIGSFIAAGGERDHVYVNTQIKKIEAWVNQIECLTGIK